MVMSTFGTQPMGGSAVMCNLYFSNNELKAEVDEANFENVEGGIIVIW